MINNQAQLFPEHLYAIDMLEKERILQQSL